MLVFDEWGRGRPLLFVHAGIADRRMWDAQITAFAGDHLVVRYDLRGFGDTPLGGESYAHHSDLAALIDDRGLARTVVVGSSMGGAAALDLALARPDAVRALVLVGAALGGHAFTDEATRAGWAATADAFAQGDREGAAAIEMAQWLPGDGRTLNDIDPAVRARVEAMLLRSYELQEGGDDVGEIELDPPAAERLAAIRVPTLAVIGERDTSDIQAIARRLGRGIAGARCMTVAGTGHLPSMERRDLFNDLLRAFLDDLAVAG